VSDLVAALGLMLVFEGLIYGGFPNAAKRLAQDVLQISEQVLRLAGIAAMAGGVLLVWLARSG
jgi:uncharacterized protein YjeT (DUF2065 family)